MEDHINGLLRDKVYITNVLADERLKREDLDRMRKRTEENFQQKIKELEATINRQKTENESAESVKVCDPPSKLRSMFISNSIKGSLMAWIRELEADYNAINATLNITRQEFQHKLDVLRGTRLITLQTPTHLCVDTYQRLEGASIKTKRGIQKAWAKCKELQEENDVLAGTHCFILFNNLLLIPSTQKKMDNIFWRNTNSVVSKVSYVTSYNGIKLKRSFRQKLTSSISIVLPD